MSALDIALLFIAGAAAAQALWQAHRADGLVVLLLERDREQRDRRAELVQVFLDDQRRQEDQINAERLAWREESAEERTTWRDERSELLNAILLADGSDGQVLMAPAWPPGPPAKLHETEEDEIREARERVAERIQADLDGRPTMLPGMGVAA